MTKGIDDVLRVGSYAREAFQLSRGRRYGPFPLGKRVNSALFG